MSGGGETPRNKCVQAVVVAGGPGLGGDVDGGSGGRTVGEGEGGVRGGFRDGLLGGRILQ